MRSGTLLNGLDGELADSHLKLVYLDRLVGSDSLPENEGTGLVEEACPQEGL